MDPHESAAPARFSSLPQAISPELLPWVRAATALRPRVPKRAGPSGRRAVLVHLDGVSHRAIGAAMREGHMPFLTRLLESGASRFDRFLVGAPASTAAFQSGLLYGRVEDVPGYLWYDKRARRNVRMDRAEDTERTEAQHAQGAPGLLAGGGSSYTTLFRGGAEAATFNLSSVRTLRWNSNFRHWPFPMAAEVLPALGVKLWSRFLAEAIPEVAETLRFAARIGRFDWEWRLLGLKLLTGIPLREAATWGTVGDIARGVPIIYTCLVDYDEVAHRRGPRSPQAFERLRGTDRCVETIFAAAAALPELQYDVYVFGDHGMTDAVPFAAIDGRDLPAMLAAAEAGDGGDPAANAHARLRRLGDRLPPPAGWLVHEAARRKAAAPPGVQIVDAGDIAHLYLTDDTDPLPWPALAQRRPRLVRALQESPAVPLFVARGPGGVVLVDGARVLHLADEQQRAAAAAHPAFAGADAETRLQYVERVASMPSAGDLVLYGNAAPDRTIAFSWEFGSHGGIAHDEIEAFMIQPRDSELDAASIHLPEPLHRFFLRYRPEPEGADARETPAEKTAPIEHSHEHGAHDSP